MRVLRGRIPHDWAAVSETVIYQPFFGVMQSFFL